MRVVSGGIGRLVRVARRMITRVNPHVAALADIPRESEARRAERAHRSRRPGAVPAGRPPCLPRPSYPSAARGARRRGSLGRRTGRRSPRRVRESRQRTALAPAAVDGAAADPDPARRGIRRDTALLRHRTPRRWSRCDRPSVHGVHRPPCHPGLSVRTDDPRGRGQWRDSNGAIERERSYELILLYPEAEAKSRDARIERIRDAYVRAHAQDSVARLDERTLADF